MIVTHFVDTGGFLISYSDGHTKQPHRQLKSSAIILTQHYSFNYKNK